MIVDASAILAIFFQESGFEEIFHKLINASEAAIGAPTLVECGIVLSSRMGQDGRGMLARFIDEIDLVIIPFTETHYQSAVGAWIKYGKGRHPAALNLGDCVAYAVAKLANRPLLCIGNDFNQTDLSIA